MSTTNTTSQKGFALKHVIAILLLIAYGIFMVYLLKLIESEEPTWTRMMMLFTSLEALVFSAAGYIFGREVHKKRAEVAESEKEKAKKEAEEAKEKQNQSEEGKSKVKDKLTTLREAVIAEHQLFNPNLGLTQFSHGARSKNTPNKPISRAYDLALQYADMDAQLVVSFSYEIEIDEDVFHSLQIGGESKIKVKGSFARVETYGKTIDIIMDRDGFDSWKFTADNIMDEQGRPMKMVNAPLISNSNKTSFQIEYK